MNLDAPQTQRPETTCPDKSPEYQDLTSYMINNHQKIEDNKTPPKGLKTEFFHKVRSRSLLYLIYESDILVGDELMIIMGWAS